MSFSRPVAEYMTSRVASVGPHAVLPHVAQELDHHAVSALPVVDDHGAILGVISRTDLLRVGRIQAGSHRQAAVLTLPGQSAGELVRASARAPLVTALSTPLRDAARTMCENRVHRLFVVDAGRLVGVLSTLDLTTAVSEAKLDGPITQIMSSPVFSVKAQQPLSAAVERLEHARVAGLVVIDDGWPVGVFTQIEAMQARDLPRETRVDEVFDPSMLCLPVETRIYRAAAQARRLAARRIIVCRGSEVEGIVTGFDFAKLVAA
jgi:CBS domain-containing protein